MKIWWEYGKIWKYDENMVKYENMMWIWWEYGKIWCEYGKIWSDLMDRKISWL